MIGFPQLASASSLCTCNGGDGSSVGHNGDSSSGKFIQRKKIK